MINVAYIITTAVYLFSGALGYLMFGNTVMDEVRFLPGLFFRLVPLLTSRPALLRSPRTS